jgi:hypothetical protein
MASKKKVVKTEDDVVEGKPVVPVVFRRTFGGYPKAGSVGYLDADLFPVWEAKGHVYKAIDVVKKPELVGDIEVDDEIDSEGQPGTYQPGGDSSVYGGDGSSDGTSDS